MQLFHQQISRLFQIEKNLPEQISSQRFAVKIICLAALVSLGCAAGLPRPHEMPPEAALALPAEAQMAELKVANPTGGVEAQVLVSGNRTGTNTRMFNALREEAITKDSAKLLKLAIALKADIDSGPDGEPSADAVAKAKEIEKLAKDVKSRMTLSIFLERP